MNSMYIDPKDNNLVCSFRNQNQVIKINRTLDGSVMWRSGRQEQRLPDWQKNQHPASVLCATTFDTNSTLILLDNGELTKGSLQPYYGVSVGRN